MPGEWMVVEDSVRETSSGSYKRFVSIKDRVNNRFYSNYFPGGASELVIKQRFQKHVREHRDELSKAQSNLDFINFEATL